ncbi:MAG TPA: hypothetical protein PKL83_03740 [bacterium]|nr:hypothetical protein [bacterium]
MYTLHRHAGLDTEKWSIFSRTKQILMIANELYRARGWIEKKQAQEVKECYERAFELIDLTVAVHLVGWNTRELLRLREMLAGLYAQQEVYVADNDRYYTALLTMDAEAFRLMQTV